MKRREVLKGLAVTSVAVTAAQSAGAASHDDEAKIVDYLFVQNAQAVSLKDGVLTLKGIGGETLYFSDRPDRIVGRVTTKEFVDHWGTGDDSFKQDPPNAVLAVLEQPEPRDIAVVLRSPRLDGDDLVYDVEVLDGAKAASGEASALFIDVIGRPLTPLSFAGQSRRVSRRTSRRVSRRR
jgi:hypothetical protein